MAVPPPFLSPCAEYKRLGGHTGAVAGAPGLGSGRRSGRGWERGPMGVSEVTLREWRKAVCKCRSPRLGPDASRKSPLGGGGGEGEVGLWCPGRRERADVPGVGSSSGVAWGGRGVMRLLFFPAPEVGDGGEEEGKYAQDCCWGDSGYAL